MTPKFRLLVACMLLCPVWAFAQNTSLRSYSLQPSGANFVPCIDGGYLIQGFAQQTGRPSLLKVDAQGNPQNSQLLDLNITIEQGTRLADGRQVLVGGSYEWFDHRGAILILDTAGQVLSAKLGGHGTFCWWNDIAATADGGCIMVGNALDTLNTKVAMLARFDSQLDTVYTRTLPPEAGMNLNLKHVVELPGGNLLVVGDRSSIQAPSSSVACMLKFTAGGDLLLAQDYPILGQGISIVQGSGYDGGGIVWMAATVVHPLPANNYTSLTGLDTIGTILNTWRIDSLREPNIRGMGTDSLGLAVIVGEALDALGNYQGFILSADTHAVQWCKSFQMNGQGFVDAVAPRPNGGYHILAHDFGFVYLAATDAQGGLLGECGMAPKTVSKVAVSGSSQAFSPSIGSGMAFSPLTVPVSPYSVNSQLLCSATAVDPQPVGTTWAVFPQPMQTHVHLQTRAGALTKSAELQVFDQAGRRVHPPVSRLHDGFEIQRGDLPAGIYAYQVLQGGQRIASGKLWVVD